MTSQVSDDCSASMCVLPEEPSFDLSSVWHAACVLVMSPWLKSHVLCSWHLHVVVLCAVLCQRPLIRQLADQLFSNGHDVLPHA